MTFSIGGYSGGLAVVMLLSFLLEWAIFQRVFDDSVRYKVISVIVAWFAGATSVGFGAATGLPLVDVYVNYGFAALFIGFLFYRQGLALREGAELAAAKRAGEISG